MDFSQVATEFRELKAQYDAGSLSEDDFKARLQDLMIQDEEGRWWMIGYQTGQWYVYKGEKWVREEPKDWHILPPGPTGPAAAPWVVLLVGVAGALLVGYAIGRWTYTALYSDMHTAGEVTGIVSALVAMLSGWLVTLALANRVRREKSLPLSLVARILAGWLACMALAFGLGWLVYRAFVNPLNFWGEALALIAGCVIGIGGSLYLALIIRRDKLGK